jgi:putative ABC transport system ATP-binding protein
MVQVENYHKSYQVGPLEVKVLRGINLEIHRGELVSIIGPSGCGKSTLMHGLGLLEKPTEGIYRIDGAPVSYDNDRELSRIRNRQIGFVFQQYHLLPRLTALENVGLPLVYRGEKGPAVRKRCLAFLEKVDMAARASHKPGEMSGGQQQRVAIARALVGSPSLILADEPTGALDSRTGQEIMNLFISLNRQEGITIVIITHDPGIARQCPRVVELADGAIVAKEERP